MQVRVHTGAKIFLKKILVFMMHLYFRGIVSVKHKSERTDAASASLYSYPRDSNPRATNKKFQKKIQKILKMFFILF
jgi:hypothetical protein